MWSESAVVEQVIVWQLEAIDILVCAGRGGGREGGREGGGERERERERESQMLQKEQPNDLQVIQALC